MYPLLAEKVSVLESEGLGSHTWSIWSPNQTPVAVVQKIGQLPFYLTSPSHSLF